MLLYWVKVLVYLNKLITIYGAHVTDEHTLRNNLLDLARESAGNKAINCSVRMKEHQSRKKLTQSRSQP